MNTFTVDTEEYPLLKVHDAKTFKNLVVSFYNRLCAQKLQVCIILQIGLFEKKSWFSAVYYRIWLERYQIIFFRSPSLANGQQTFKIKPVNTQSRSSRTLIKRTPADMELSIYLKHCIYLYSYKTEIAIFIVTKHEKTIMAVL